MHSPDSGYNVEYTDKGRSITSPCHPRTSIMSLSWKAVARQKQDARAEAIARALKHIDTDDASKADDEQYLNATGVCSDIRALFLCLKRCLSLRDREAY